MHELGHRLESDLFRSFEVDHAFLFLWLYAAWVDASVSDGFTQKVPHEGRPPTERTRLRVLYDDRALYEKLMLDGFQAGLSWITILRKRDNFRAAFDGFNPEKIARYSPKKVERLMRDHAAGHPGCGETIWSLFNLELWHRTFIDNQGVQTLPARRRPSTDAHPLAAIRSAAAAR